jgi:hypothetical protein
MVDVGGKGGARCDAVSEELVDTAWDLNIGQFLLRRS